jgi:hypothetical protein
MTKPLSTKNRSTPSAPAVTSGPTTSTTAATPGSGLKWKWNNTTQAAATIRNPVSPRSSLTIGATRSPRAPVRTAVRTYRDAARAHRWCIRVT